jgi:hypothetical protein
LNAEIRWLVRSRWPAHWADRHSSEKTPNSRYLEAEIKTDTERMNVIHHKGAQGATYEGCVQILALDCDPAPLEEGPEGRSLPIMAIFDERNGKENTKDTN